MELRMEKIPNEFRKYRYDFKMLKREGCIALYSQSKKGEVLSFEVHKIRVYPQLSTDFGQSGGKMKTYPEREVLASKGEFGKYGWSYQTYEYALKNFNEKVKKSKEE